MSDHELARRPALWPLGLPPSHSSLPPLVQRMEASGGATCRLGDASCASAQASHIGRWSLGDSAMLHRSITQLQRDHGNRFVGQVLRMASGEHGAGDMDTIERSIQSARGGGQGLDHATQRQMEGSFGADFSGVRIHNDARADGLSQSLSARAFTTGQDVFFRQGEYNPGTSAGRELLAHELTHVVQQTGGLQRKMTVSQPGDVHEQEADQMARQVIAQEHAQRQPEAPKANEEDDKKLGRSPADTARQQEDEMP